MSDDEAVDVYLLWRHGREDPEITVRRPAWVVDLLAGYLRQELGDDDDRGGPRPDPFDNVPKGLETL